MAEYLPIILEGVKAAPGVVDGIVKSSSKLLDSTREFSHKATNAVEDAITKLDEIKHTEVKYDYKSRAAFQDIKIAADKALAFVNSVDDLFYYGKNKDRIKDVKKAIMIRNFAPLRDYIDILQRCLGNAGQFYEDFKEACDEAVESTENAAMNCQHKAKEAKSKKTATQAIGGTVAGTAIAGGVGAGVALSVVAGVLTFGVGAIVGLSITAVSATAAGVGVGATTAAVTHIIATDFEDVMKAFRSLEMTFQFLLTTARDMNTSTAAVKSKLDLLATNVDAVSADHRTVRSLCDALDLLCRRFEEYYAVSSSCLATLTSKKNALESSM